METRLARQGWIILLGVPTLFFCAYIIAAAPTLVNFPLCVVKMFVGIDCPGCGLTRSIAFLTHGQIRKSVDFHPLGIIIALWLLYMFIREAINAVFKKSLKPLLSQKARDTILFGFIAAIITQWLIKLYFFLFTFNF